MINAMVGGSICRAQPGKVSKKEQRDQSKIKDSDLERERRVPAVWITSLIVNSIGTSSNNNHLFRQIRAIFPIGV